MPRADRGELWVPADREPSLWIRYEEVRGPLADGALDRLAPGRRAPLSGRPGASAEMVASLAVQVSLAGGLPTVGLPAGGLPAVGLPAVGLPPAPGQRVPARAGWD